MGPVVLRLGSAFSGYFRSSNRLRVESGRRGQDSGAGLWADSPTLARSVPAAEFFMDSKVRVRLDEDKILGIARKHGTVMMTVSELVVAERPSLPPRPAIPPWPNPRCSSRLGEDLPF
jgi:hypothetical protein